MGSRTQITKLLQIVSVVPNFGFALIPDRHGGPSPRAVSSDQSYAKSLVTLLKDKD